MNIIFVCTGNICRSPFAELLLKKIAKENGYPYVVSSMGTINREGYRAPQTACDIANTFGVDLSNHTSRAMNIGELLKSDIIFVMDRSHKEHLKTYYPSIIDKVHLLAPYKKGGIFRKNDVKDPFKKSEKVFQKVYSEIQEHIQRILPLE